jgi:hypothetical protein
MLKFLEKWLQNRKSKQLNKEDQAQSVALVSRSHSIESIGMNFTLYRANGGYIIEHRVYDHKTECNNSSLHIITEEKNLGEEIAKIITFENLRS